MLYDIFKEDFKPGVKYKVDKDLVLKYRKFVFDNLLIIQDKNNEPEINIYSNSFMQTGHFLFSSNQSSKHSSQNK